MYLSTALLVGKMCFDSFMLFLSFKSVLLPLQHCRYSNLNPLHVINLLGITAEMIYCFQTAARGQDLSANVAVVTGIRVLQRSSFKMLFIQSNAIVMREKGLESMMHRVIQ